MPFSRPTPPAILSRIQAEIDVLIPGSESRLRQTVEGVIARVIAMASHEMHGFLAWIAKQIFVSTADQENLERHGSEWKVVRKLPTKASGSVNFVGVSGSIIYAGTILRRADDAQYIVTEDVIFSGPSASVDIEAAVVGKNSNTVAGVKLSLSTPVLGVQTEGTIDSFGLYGGTDIEDIESYRARILEKMHNPPQGGSDADYKIWATSVPGVTRAWPYANQMGLGTVTVLFVMDDKDGTIIPSSSEVSDVQDYIDAVRPTTAEVFVAAPVAVPMDMEIHIRPDTPSIRAAIEEELKDLIRRESVPGGTLYVSRIREAISVANGEFDHVLITPSANVVRTFGQMTTLGTITWGAL